MAAAAHGVRAGGDDLRRRLLLALFVGLDRRAEGHRARALEPDRDRGALREADPRHPRGRRRVLGGEAVLRLRPRQRPHVSAGGRRDDGADGRAADAGRGVRAAAQAPADDLLRRARRCIAALLASPDLPARGELAMRVCTSAGEALPADIGKRWTEHFGVEILDGLGSTEMLHIFLSNRPGERPLRHQRHAGARLRAAHRRRRRPAGRARRGRRAAGQRTDRGDGILEQPGEDAGPRSRDRGRAAATSTRSMPTATTSTPGAPTTC